MFSHALIIIIMYLSTIFMSIYSPHDILFDILKGFMIFIHYFIIINCQTLLLLYSDVINFLLIPFVFLNQCCIIFLLVIHFLFIYCSIFSYYLYPRRRLSSLVIGRATVGAQARYSLPTVAQQ